VGTPTSLYHYTNRASGVRAVPPGIHALSNARLNTPWPKVTRARRALQAAFQRQNVTDEALFELLNDRRPAPDEALPDTGLGRERERMLSPLFIESEHYGTRASTVLRIGRAGTISLAERTFEQGEQTETRHFAFEATPAAAF
jgi:uncharacterized protein with NRDE domain